jgi:hypothetical protein
MRALSCLLLAASLGASVSAAAQERRVIQNRTHGVNHEFSIHAGLLPLDVLYKAPVITGRYTWHVTPYLSWEALSLTYAPTTDISLFSLGFGPVRVNHFSAQGNELQDNFGYAPFDVDQFRFMAESNLVLKPLYGKFSMFNRSNARVELFATGGLALANFVAFNPYPFDPLAEFLRGNSPIPVAPATPLDVLPKPGQTFMLRPGVNVGGGIRWFAFKRVTFRLDGRAYGFLEGINAVSLPGAPTSGEQPRSLPELPVAFTPMLYVGTGLSLSLGG